MSPILEMKIWSYKSESNSWIYFDIVLKKFTGLNKVLLVLGQMIGAHREDCLCHTGGLEIGIK